MLLALRPRLKRFARFVPSFMLPRGKTAASPKSRAGTDRSGEQLFDDGEFDPIPLHSARRAPIGNVAGPEGPLTGLETSATLLFASSGADGSDGPTTVPMTISTPRYVSRWVPSSTVGHSYSIVAINKSSAGAGLCVAWHLELLSLPWWGM